MRQLTERDKQLIIDSIPAYSPLLFAPGLQGRGSTLLNRAPAANHGTISGCTWTRLPSGLWVLSFNGTTDLVTLASVITLTDPNIFTILAWIKPTTGNTVYGILGHNDQASTIHFEVGDDPSGATSKFATLFAGQYLARSSARTDWSLQWNLLGYVSTGTLVGDNLLYLNGASVALDRDNAKTLVQATNATELGRYSASVGSFAGLMWPPIVVDGGLTAAQMLQVHTRTRHLFGV